MKRLKIARIVIGALALGTACSNSSNNGGTGGSGGTRTIVAGTGGSPADAAPNPSTEFRTLYTTILSVKCSPCHTTQANKPPNGNPLDMSDVVTAYLSLTTVSTMNCLAAPEKRRVVSGGFEASYLIRKLVGNQPASCGLRMPRTPMRTDPPGCADPSDAAPASSDGPAASDGGPGDGGGVEGSDAAATQPPPRACLSTAELTAVRNWINNGAF
jgi:hypothetical protein